MWNEPRVERVRVVEHPERGRAVLAAEPIAAGEEVLVFGGERLRGERIRDFTHTLEIVPGVFLGPSGAADDYVNHSCEPNCVVKIEEGRAVLRALRDISRGQEVTFDYATSMFTDPIRFECACGAASCRGVVFGGVAKNTGTANS